MIHVFLTVWSNAKYRAQQIFTHIFLPFCSPSKVGGFMKQYGASILLQDGEHMTVIIEFLPLTEPYGGIRKCIWVFLE